MAVIQEQNYNAYPILRMPFAPMTIDAYFIQSDNPPTGMGEPAFPALAPALGNAIFAATGERVRQPAVARSGLFAGCLTDRPHVQTAWALVRAHAVLPV